MRISGHKNFASGGSELTSIINPLTNNRPFSKIGVAAESLPLVAIGSTRGDPTNVDVPAATAAGIPVLRAPGRNADAVAEIAVALLFSVTRHVITADHDVRARAKQLEREQQKSVDDVARKIDGQ